LEQFWSAVKVWKMKKEKKKENKEKPFKIARFCFWSSFGER